jgi:hypothetical protein
VNRSFETRFGRLAARLLIALSEADRGAVVAWGRCGWWNIISGPGRQHEARLGGAPGEDRGGGRWIGRSADPVGYRGSTRDGGL